MHRAASVHHQDNVCIPPLVRLGEWLRQKDYRFTTTTPATHARVNARAENREARSCHDVFGWSRPFRRELLPPMLLHLLMEAGELSQCDDLWTSTVRFSSIGDRLYVHSAYPTIADDAVFFGPDTYRFIDFLKCVIGKARCLVDIGCGTGAGGLEFSHCTRRMVLCDINAKALRYAKVNAMLNGCRDVHFQHSDVLQGVDEKPDVIVCNPPYLVDPHARIYRHGGGPLGIDLSVRIIRDALARLAPGGRLAMYTGTPITRGNDPLRDSIIPMLSGCGAKYRYREMDPDVFGEELDHPLYANVDRIAAVTLIAVLPT